MVEWSSILAFKKEEWKYKNDTNEWRILVFSWYNIVMIIIFMNITIVK